MSFQKQIYPVWRENFKGLSLVRYGHHKRLQLDRQTSSIS